MTRVNQGIRQFYLPHTHEPHLLLLPSRTASPPLAGTRYPRMDAQAELTWVTGYTCILRLIFPGASEPGGHRGHVPPTHN